MSDCRLPTICNQPGVSCTILPTPTVSKDRCGNATSYIETVTVRTPPRNCR
jgi:hypothetical protein